MRAFYVWSTSGKSTIQGIHLANGVSIVEDPERCRYIFGQHIPSRPHGIIDSDKFSKGLEAEIPPGGSITLEKSNSSVIIPYHVRDVVLTDEAERGLERITAYSAREHEPLKLTRADEQWFRDLSANFPEFITMRLPGMFVEIGV